jgi:uncharacterized YigZ family protein
MSQDDEHFTIAKPASAQTLVKGSRFIAHAEAIVDKESAENFVSKISAQYRDATHNCFAYKIGVGDAAIFRFSDAGEPSGTAGRPILQALEIKKLTNAAVVVARYFGGAKLGTGGLARAYQAAALAALNQAPVVPYFLQIKLRIRFLFKFTNAVHQLLNKFRGQILESRFGEPTQYVIQIKAIDVEAFAAELRDATRGLVGIETLA